MAWTTKSILPHFSFSTSNTASMVAGVGDVAMAQHQAADLGGQRLDPLLQRVALIGQRDLGALGVAGLGNAPGDRTVIGDAEHHASLALHQARKVSQFRLLLP